MSFQEKLAFFQHLVSENQQTEENTQNTDNHHDDHNKDQREKLQNDKEIEQIIMEEERKKKEEEDKKKIDEQKQREQDEKKRIEEEKRKNEEIERLRKAEAEKKRIEELQKAKQSGKFNTQKVDSETVLDFETFPYLFIDKNTTLTESDLKLSDLFIAEYRNSKTKINPDVLQFNLTLTKILSTTTKLVKIRTVLLIFLLKNAFDISTYFPTLLTEDILFDNPKEELFCKSEHRYFNAIFYNELKKHPLLMMNVVEVIKEFIQIHSIQFDSIFPLISSIIFANDDTADPLPYDQLNFLNQNKDLKKFEKQIMNSFPSILPFEVKYGEFKKQLNLNNHFYLCVDREKIMEAVLSLVSMKEKTFKLEVLFNDEPGVDSDGGVSREFIQLAFKELLKEETDLFVLHDGFYWFKYHKEVDDELIKKYKCAGILFSAAILNSITIPGRFPRYFYKKMLRREITVSDLAFFDQTLYKTVIYLINNEVSSSDNFDFVYSNDFYKYQIDLYNFREVTNSSSFKPRQITEDNKQSFIVKLKEWIFSRSIRKEFEAFDEGFRKVILNRLFFDWFCIDEIGLIVSGKSEYNWSDLKNSAEYTNPYSEKSKVIQWFWSYFDKLGDDGKKNVLKFITGTSNAPPGGLKDVHIKFNPSKKNLPVSHTCFGSLDLPEFRSYEDLQNKCDLAFPYSEGYGYF